MKSLLKTLSTLVFTTTVALTSMAEADTGIQIGLGYRSDDYKFSTKTPDDIALNTHSKLNFRDVEIVSLLARAKGFCDCMYYRVDGEFGWIVDGNARESDQFSFPVKKPLTRSTETTIVHPVFHNHVDDKYVAGLNFVIGYPIHQCFCHDIQLIPTIGFSYDTQRVRFKNRHNVTEVLSSHTREKLGLRNNHKNSSKFRTTWWGPSLGLDFTFCQSGCWNGYGEFEFHFARRRGERNSNTGIRFLDRNRRTRSAYGVNLRLGTIYQFMCHWYVDGHINYRNFWSDRHSNDKVTWRSLGLGVDVGYIF